MHDERKQGLKAEAVSKTSDPETAALLKDP
jgi:hypothetical protein